MKNPFRRTPLDTPEGAQQAVKQAHARLEAAKAALAEAKAAHGRAVLASDEGEDNAAAEVSRSRTRLDKAEQALADAEVALAAAEARFQEVQSKMQDDDTADRWRRCEALAAERMKVAGELEKLAKQFADKLAVLLQLGTDLHSLAPLKPGRLTDALCGPNVTVRLVRDELARAGCPWSQVSVSTPLADLRPLADGIAEGNGEVLKESPTHAER